MSQYCGKCTSYRQFILHRVYEIVLEREIHNFVYVFHGTNIIQAKLWSRMS